MAVFWVVVACNLVAVNQHFKAPLKNISELTPDYMVQQPKTQPIFILATLRASNLTQLFIGHAIPS
jgi:hypothetical protein